MDEDRRIQYLVHRLLSGKLLIPDGDRILELRSPSLQIQYESDIVYKHHYEQNIFEFILKEDIKPLLLESGVITPFHEQDLKKMNKKLERLKVQLFTDFWDRTKTARHRKSIASVKKRINQLEVEGSSMDHLTLEHFCFLESMKYIIKKTLYDSDTGELFFDDDTPPHDYERLLVAINKESLDMSEIKKIARSSYWKSYHSIGNENTILGHVSDYSNEQKSVISLSMMYAKIAEHPESPNDDIMNDDDALDGWMIFQQEKNQEEKRNSNNNNKKDKINNAQEVFYMAENKDQAEDIRALNTTESHMVSKNRMNQLFTSDTEVNAADFRDTRDRLNQAVANHQKKA